MKLYFLVILLIFICANNFVYTFPNYPQDEEQEQEQFAVWSEHAEVMKSYINSSANPCDNFYEYACGRWDEKYRHFIKGNERIDMIRKVLKSIEPKNKLEKQVKTFYDSCRNRDEINRKSLPSVRSFVDYLGGWPDLEQFWSEKHFDLINTLIKRTLTGQKSIINVDVGRDIMNSSAYIIYIKEPVTGLKNIDNYLKHDGDNLKNLNAYRTLILHIFTNIYNYPSDIADRMANDIINFEILLTEFKSPAHFSDKDKNNSTTLQSLLENYPNFNWVKLLNGIFGHEIPLNQKINIFGIPLFDKLINLITTTKTKILANYMAWQTLFQLSIEYILGSDFSDAIYKFETVILGPVLHNHRLCTQKTTILLDYIVSSIFFKKIKLNPALLNAVEEMTDIMKDEFANRLDEAHWLDSDTQYAAHLKLSHVNLAIGYPDILNDEQKLVEYYKDLDILEEDKFLQNYVQLTKFNFKKRLSLLNTVADKLEWPHSALSMKPYFYNEQNRIIIPGAVLQPPIYHKYFPQALKYGGLGFHLGQQLTHGFDSKGKEFNSDGDIESWWTPESEINFINKTTCLVEQYSQYSLNGTHVSGNHTLLGNIADNGAIRLAYDSYKKWLQLFPDEEERLLNTDITNEKLFFLTVAQSMCSSRLFQAEFSHINKPIGYPDVLTDEQKITQYDNQPLHVHNPSEFRIKGMFQNLPEFSEAYECASGSPMNPEHKCTLW